MCAVELTDAIFVEIDRYIFLEIEFRKLNYYINLPRWHRKDFFKWHSEELALTSMRSGRKSALYANV